MPILVVLRRFEIWLLVLLVTGLVIFAFQTEPSIEVPFGQEESETASIVTTEVANNSAQPSKSANSVSLREVKVIPSGNGRIVELTVAGRSTSGSDIALDESTVTATTGEGEVVPLFFEPFREPSHLLATEDSLATLRWWLESPADTILLQVQGESIRAELP